MIGKNKSNSLIIDVSLHLGSLIAIVFYFRKELFDLKSNHKLLFLILIGSLPLILFGYILYVTDLILILRDIKKLYELLNYNLKLGLTIKNSLIAKNFFNIRKPENILFGIGIDLTRVFFKYNKQLQPFQNILLRNINKNKIVQKIGKLIADKGLI